jgi:hypothetical protein
MYLIELTKEEDKKREDDTPSIQVPLPVVGKTKPIEIRFDLRDHQNKFKNQDEDECSYVTNTRTGQRIPTRGLQNGNQGRTLEKPSEKSLGKRTGHSIPKPAASQFKEGHCSCCKQAHLTPECPKFKSLSNQKRSTIFNHQTR